MANDLHRQDGQSESVHQVHVLCRLLQLLCGQVNQQQTTTVKQQQSIASTAKSAFFSFTTSSADHTRRAIKKFGHTFKANSAHSRSITDATFVQELLVFFGDRRQEHVLLCYTIQKVHEKLKRTAHVRSGLL
jgi:4-hydroxy-3-methylbut-2-enyl diphosphate reductase IspH